MLSRTWRLCCRRYSQSVNFRTTEASPTKHTANHVGLFYNLDEEVNKQLFSHGGFPKTFTKQTKTFAETAIMVRRPALDIMECIKASDMNKPANRYVIYGEKGAGKSITLAHLLHYAQENGFIIIHIPWVSEWLRRTPRHKEMSNSSTREGMVDVPLDAAAWLLHFKSQNLPLLKQLELKTTRELVWSKRETTAEGAPLLELVEFGINRVKYACDVIDALVQNIKQHSNSKNCKTFVAIDGYNCFFYPLTRLRTSTKREVRPEEVSLTKPVLDITRNDWTNGAIVVTVDELAVPEDHHESFLPKYQLFKKGFEHIDPFVPIEVVRYTDKEFMSCASYYRDRLWLRGPEDLEKELQFNTAGNPFKFQEICAPL